MIVVNAEVIDELQPRSSRRTEALPFNTVLLYEDSRLGDRAWDFYEKLTHQFEDDFDFRHLMWSFSVLGDPKTLRLAADSAADAHLVILSLSGRTELPAVIRNWVARWVRLVKHKSALVTLLDPKAKAGPRAATLAYLREMLEANGIEFFPQSTSTIRLCHLE